MIFNGGKAIDFDQIIKIFKSVLIVSIKILGLDLSH
jgi:hypothetical protein